MNSYKQMMFQLIIFCTYSTVSVVFTLNTYHNKWGMKTQIKACYQNVYSHCLMINTINPTVWGNQVIIKCVTVIRIMYLNWFFWHVLIVCFSNHVQFNINTNNRLCTAFFNQIDIIDRFLEVTVSNFD